MSLIRVSRAALQLVLEGADDSGLDRAPLVEGLAGVELPGPPSVPWPTFVALLDRIYRALGDDDDLMREFGGRLVRTPSFHFLQSLAHHLLPPRALYEAGVRFYTPSLFPHTPLEMTFETATRVRFHREIPRGELGCRAFLLATEGHLRELPRLVGLPRARVLVSRHETHRMELLLELPRRASLVEAARGLLHRRLYEREIREVYSTQRREVEIGMQELLRASTELRDLLDRMPDLALIHRAGTILWANRGLARALGIDSAQLLVGRTLSSLIHPSDWALLEARLARGESPQDRSAPPDPVRLVRHDGEVLLVEAAPAKGVSFAGRPARLVIGHDVTERARLQQRLATADRLASLGLLAAGVAHEINNPLAYATTSIEVAARDLSRSDSPLESVRGALETALDGLGRVRAIVQDLRLLARGDSEPPAAVELDRVVDTTLRMARGEIAARARLVRDYQAASTVRASEARLGQVILNLVTNALAAMPSGVPAENELAVRTFRDGDRVGIDVSDNGVGIAPAVAARVFDPFFTTKSAGLGTGLGLTVCHQIVTALGGTIEARPHADRGTTFRVLLPRASDAPPAVAASGARRAPAASDRARVLVVDDERRMRDAIGRLLDEHDVVLAGSVDEALAAVATDGAFDLVLCDVVMPGRSGIDLFRALAAGGSSLCERVVFMTGGAATPDLAAALEEIGRPEIDKPFGGEEIARLIAGALAARRRAVETSPSTC